MGKKKKGWKPSYSFRDSSAPESLSEPPSAEAGSNGMEAKSQPPPGLGEPSAEDRFPQGPESADTLGEVASDATEEAASQPRADASAMAEPAADAPAETPHDEALSSEAADPTSHGSHADEEAEPGERTTTIGPTIIIRGKLTSDESLIVRGRIEAEITSSKDLQLEETGIINADMRLSSVTIRGIVVGDIHARERVRLAPQARVVGDIYTPRLVVEDGASFRGHVEMDGLEHLEELKPSTATADAGASASMDEAPMAARDDADAPRNEDHVDGLGELPVVEDSGVSQGTGTVPPPAY